MKKLVLLATTAILAVFAVPMAVGAEDHVDSDVTLNFVGDQYGGIFFGNVDSNKGKCEKNREVKVKTTDQYGKDKIGEDDTNEDGDYFVQAESVAEADYQATAKEKVVHKKRHPNKVKYICDKAKSNIIHAP